MGGQIKKWTSHKNVYIVSYALKVSVNSVTCLFVVQVKKIHLSLWTGLTVNIHMSTKTCVTGNNLILRKALVLRRGALSLKNVRRCTLSACDAVFRTRSRPPWRRRGSPSLRGRGSRRLTSGGASRSASAQTAGSRTWWVPHAATRGPHQGHIFQRVFLLYSFWLLISKVVAISLFSKISIINLLYQLGLQV